MGCEEFITMVLDSIHDLRIEERVVTKILPLLQEYLEAQPQTQEKTMLIQKLIAMHPKFHELLVVRAPKN